eukprot:TRINITY_DN22476_c1_g1_i1.p1 TRINITY_DN22476_c1_g1~~TRINITY_DN22476_c1_g1_i1.p1  ORF type:complete len:361 (+),score=79.97 TRINITY_DN22476_c1_g1_i1:111-1085(+)
MAPAATEVKDFGDQGRGRGLVATRDLKVGDCILDEAPLVSVGNRKLVEWPLILLWCSWSWYALGTGLEAWFAWGILAMLLGNAIIKVGEFVKVILRVRLLDETDRKRYQSLFTFMRSDLPFCDTLTIWRSNALPNGNGKGAVFANACLLNHSCAPNAYHCFNEKQKRLTVHCMRPIKKGEEVTISYVKVWQKKEDRQMELQHQYRFHCRCQVCTLPEKEQEVSDERRARIGLLMDGEARRTLMPKSVKEKDGMPEIEELLDLLDKEFGDPSYKGDVCWEASNIYRAIGNAKVARTWATKAHKLLVMTKGASDPDAQTAKYASSQ